MVWQSPTFEKSRGCCPASDPARTTWHICGLRPPGDHRHPLPVVRPQRGGDAGVGEDDGVLVAGRIAGVELEVRVGRGLIMAVGVTGVEAGLMVGAAAGDWVGAGVGVSAKGSGRTG